MRGRVGQAVVILWTVLFFHFCDAVPVLPVGLVATYETVKPGKPLYLVSCPIWVFIIRDNRDDGGGSLAKSSLD